MRVERVSEKENLKKYVVNGILCNNLEKNELLRLINLLPDEPQLNDNQKALVIWMQENECYTGDPLESISDLFLEATPSEHFPGLPLSCVEAAYQSLTNQQKIEMAQEYLRRHLEQEEE